MFNRLSCSRVSNLISCLISISYRTIAKIMCIVVVGDDCTNIPMFSARLARVRAFTYKLVGSHICLHFELRAAHVLAPNLPVTGNLLIDAATEIEFLAGRTSSQVAASAANRCESRNHIIRPFA